MVRWGKKFNFRPEDKEYIEKFINDVEEEGKYSNVADCLFDIIKTNKDNIRTEEALTSEQLDKLCTRKLLALIGGVPTCNQKIYPFGLQRQEYFIYKKGIQQLHDGRQHTENCQ